ncbi:MAG: hemerythrin domain-containing protein [Gallionellaceae bacterium]|nr:hemerythrin domain-containing protein [Gallionellaceae bacterium]
MEKTKQQSAGSGKNDAISLLMQDHKAVKKLFKEFESLKDDEDSDDQKAEIVQQICTQLTIHAQIEEEIFYPAAREAIDDGDVIDEAEVEHAGVKELITQLESMQPGDDQYDAKVTVLSEYIKHHVGEEEGQMFPQVRKAKVDLQALGEALQERKEELMAEMDIMPEPHEIPAKSPSGRRSISK